MATHSDWRPPPSKPTLTVLQLFTQSFQLMTPPSTGTAKLPGRPQASLHKVSSNLHPLYELAAYVPCPNPGLPGQAGISWD